VTGRWRDLGPDGEATAEAAFVALETVAALERPAGVAALAPSALWAHLTGAAPLPPTTLAAALLAFPASRAILAGLLERAAVAIGPRVAAAATGARVTERVGDGFRLRLLPARGAAAQTWIVITLDHVEPSPSGLTALRPEGGSPVSVALEPPVDGVVQLLAETDSELVLAVGDPASTVFLH